MKKTFKKRAFISAIAMLIVSAIVLTSATYAWFSMAKRVEVESMELNVTSPEGIQISANTSAFTTKLTVANIVGNDDTAAGKRFNAYTGHMNNVPTTVKPSSSVFTTAGALPQWFDGSINDQGTMDIYSANEFGSGFVAFDLFVKVKDATTVKFGNSTIECAANEDLKTAMRIAILNCGTVDENADSTAIQSTLNLTTADTSKKVIFELDGNNHSAGAIASGAVNGTYVSTRGIARAGLGISCNPTYNNIVSYNTGDVNAKIATAATDANIKVSAGITRLRVYMWMEGNDIDCANDIAGSTINCNLVLEID